MTSSTPRFVSVAASDQGPVRPNNEDRVYIDDPRGIFLVVDGMGGHEAGEHAAEIAVETIRTRLERQTGAVEQRVREAIALANNAIYEAAAKNPAWGGMACVLSLAVLDGSRFVVGHVGDSRVYLIRKGAIQKITHDHSPVGEREDRGELSEADAMRHPRRNEVFRDVGTEPHDPDDEDFIEIQTVPFEPDSALLICSDGLSDAVRSSEILRLVQRYAANRRAAVQTLIAEANKIGKDNVSVVLVLGEDFASSVGASAIPAGDEDTGRLASASQPWYAGRWSWGVLGILIGAALGVAALIAWNATRTVKPQQPTVVNPPATIQAALESAKPGDIIHVAPGTYTGPVRLKDGVTLIAGPAYEATILGSVTAAGIHDARLEGFRIRESDIGVRVHDADLTITRCDISQNRLAGVEISGNARAWLTGSSIHGNAGPGIVLEDAAVGVIEHNAVYENATRPGALGPGLLIRSSFRPEVVANTFFGNGAEAIWLASADPTIERDNFFPPPPKSGAKVRVIPLRPGASK